METEYTLGIQEAGLGWIGWILVFAALYFAKEMFSKNDEGDSTDKSEDAA
jgi:hypothetical protein